MFFNKNIILIRSFKNPNLLFFKCEKSFYKLIYTYLYHTLLYYNATLTQIDFSPKPHYITNSNSYLNRNYNMLITSIISGFFKKLKFKGKGYYVYKDSRHTLTFRFGKFHRTYILHTKTKLKLLSKRSLILWSRNKTHVSFAATSIKLVRPINIFTGRGIRFNKEVIYKKIGKESNYR